MPVDFNNLQAIFDTVAKHLMTQGRPAVRIQPDWDGNPEVVCCYRADGLQCAVGCLIPDKLYEQRFEGTWGPEVLMDLGYIERRECMTSMSSWSPRVRLIHDLQTLHDSVSEDPPEDCLRLWKKGLDAIAKRFGLKPWEGTPTPPAR